MFASLRFTPFIQKLILTMLLAIAMPAQAGIPGRLQLLWAACSQASTGLKNGVAAMFKEPVQWIELRKQDQCRQILVGPKAVLSIGAIALVGIYRVEIKRAASKLF